jgi:hypothetical protein
MLEWDLFNVKPIKGNNTCSNKILGKGHISARLDIFLIHSSFLGRNLNIISKIVPSAASDKKPISLILDVGNN